ncbi:MFS transporter [Nonomuraea gerenzanensis]|uniref:Drug resistance transporter EmrB/QacA subfamily n=1 Tax=Nonomuraea gerenzanensis TaxID=93944 RepID=A0A1M4ER58_9ACTN|nr:MFS transporter [Nonomuraea gerenzanensis]UBU12752.1 MFS transporter [Nonomuraea gerenzanensis]SBP01308.1 Drug resistance transporter EmrB/QacA subfamily [Nonomuraea gerenzanensis]
MSLTVTRRGRQRRSARAWPLFLVTGLAGFMTTLDNTIVTVAIPTIQRDLGASLAALEWVATGYILTFSGLMLAGGRLADVHGHRRVLLAGLAAFTAASLGAGLAGSIEVLVAARLAQGAGAALILPATLAALAGREERQRSTGVAVWMASGAAALALGPVAGGYVSQHAHWSWVFLANVPLGALVMGLVAVGVPDGAGDSARPAYGAGDSARRAAPASGPAHRAAAAARRPGWRELDVPGVVASVVFLAAGTFALIHGGAHGWTSPAVVVAVLVCAGGGAAFVVAERRAREPMVEPGLFRVRSFAGGVAAQVLWGLGVNGVFFYTAIFLQEVLGFTPTASGVAFVPLALLVVVVTPVVPVVERWLGAGRTVAAGLVLVAGGMALAATLEAGDGWGRLLPAVCAIGVGSALTMPLGSAVLGAVPEARAGVAGGIFSVSREISGLFGIAAVGVIVHAAGAFAAGYAVGLLVAAGLVLVGALISLVSLP